MDRASTLAFPGGRFLAAWLRQLQRLQPRALWVGYLFVHRVEALAVVETKQNLDPCRRLFLEACRTEETASGTIHAPRLALRLALPLAAARGPALELVRLGLLCGASDRGTSDRGTSDRGTSDRGTSDRGTSDRGTSDQWTLTPLGVQVSKEGAMVLPVGERRTLTFVERLDASGQRRADPVFAPFKDAPAQPWPADQTHRFERPWLEASLAQAREWKAERQFPLELVAFRFPAPAPAEELDWNAIVVDRTERVFVCGARHQSKEGSERWSFFAVKPESWTLLDANLVLEPTPAVLAETFPDIEAPPSLAQWREAWVLWCRQRNFSTQDAEAAEVLVEEGRLAVKAPAKLAQRLNAPQTELAKGEAWLVPGAGYFRPALPIALIA